MLYKFTTILFTVLLSLCSQTIQCLSHEIKLLQPLSTIESKYNRSFKVYKFSRALSCCKSNTSTAIRRLKAINVRVNSCNEHPSPDKPRAFVARVSEAGYLEVNNVPTPGHLQTTKKLACNILSLFPTGLRVKGFRHRRFEMRRSFIDHKRRVSVKPGTPQNPRNPPESPWNPSELPQIPGTSPEPPWISSKPPGTFRYTIKYIILTFCLH